MWIDVDGSDYVSMFELIELFRPFFDHTLACGECQCVKFNLARKEEQMAAENGLRPET